MRPSFVAIVLLAGLFFPLSAGADDDLARLAHPDVAERLDLSDEQRAKIQQLLLRRTEASADQEDAERAQKVQEIEREILAVLSDDQQGRWAEDEPRGDLEFQFREQPWADVLQWFARQEGLTLVMDREPPGTFTYTDTRQYTSAQAIDLLNSVLLTRGFTLLRRERMLTLIQLSDSIPIELIPEVSLEELPSRGRFELVRVNFSLGARPPDAVLREVTPYLGRYGRALPLAQNRRLMVIESAGKMETINMLINSVPEPKKEEKPTPEKPPQPVFAAYPLGELDPQATAEAVRKLVNSEQITVDPGAGLLSAFVIPNQQVAIQSVIEKLQSSRQAGPATTSVAYRLGDAEPEGVREQITAVAPQAILSIDTARNRLFVTASEASQQRIATALEALGITRTGADVETRAFQIDPDQASDLAAALQAMLADSQVIGNDRLGTLIVRGPADDHAVAEDLIRRWQTDDGLEGKILHAFPLAATADQAWLETVAKLAPRAELWLGNDQRQLVLLGSAADRDRIEKALPQLLTFLEQEPDRKLRTYVLEAAELERWQQLQGEWSARLSEVRMVTEPAEGSRPAQLLVWASDEDHAWIADLLDQLRESTPDRGLPLPRRYDLEGRDGELVIQLVEARFPGVRPGGVGEDEITFWADPETHASIEEWIDAVRDQLPRRDQRKLVGYGLPEMPPAELETLLGPILRAADDGATVTVDPERGRLLIRASEQAHRDLEELVEQLRAPSPADQEKILLAYTLEHGDADELKDLIESSIRGATVLADADRGRLVATATLQQHGKIKAIVAEVDRPAAAPRAKQVHVYPLQDIQAAALLPMLESLWPKMEISIDTAGNQLIATGSTADHEGLRNTLEQMVDGGGQDGRGVETYAVPFGDLRSLPAVLTQIAPRAVVSVDATNRAVVVWGSPADQRRIGQAIEQLSATASQTDEIMMFRVPTAEATSYRLALAALFPTAKVAADTATGQLTVLAPEPLQQPIRDLIEKRREAIEEADRGEPKTYTVPRRQRSAFLSLLADTVPEARLIEGDPTRSDAVMIFAHPEDHQKVARLVEQLRAESSPEEEGEVRVYRLDRADPTAFAALLDQRRPEARVISGGGTKRLLIADTASGHERLVAMAEELEQAFEETADRQLRVHPLREDLGQQASAGIRATFPDVLLLTGNDPTRLTAVATPSDHERLAKWLEQLAENLPPPDERTATTYSLDNANPLSVQQAITQIYPDAAVTADSTSGSLVVSATASQQERIAKLVEDLNAAPGRSETLETYRAEHIDAEQAATIIRDAFGRRTSAAVTADREAGLLFVVARPEQQKIAAKLLEQIDREGAGRDRTTRVFPLRRGDALSLSAAVAQMAPAADVSPERSSNSLIVTADDETMVQIAAMIEDVDRGGQDGLVTKTYVMEIASPLAIQQAVTQIFPDAKVAADSSSGGLVIQATAEQHEQIATLVDDVNAAPGRGETLETYRAEHIDAEEAATIIRDAFGRRTSASVSADRDAGLLFVVARPEQQRIAANVLEQIDRQDSGRNARQTRVFPLIRGDALSLSAAVAQMAPAADVSPERSSNSLIVTADPVTIEKVAAMIEQVDNGQPGRQLTKTYSLEVASPISFQRALGDLFPGATAAADSASGGLVVSATAEQHEQIATLVDDLNAAPGRSEQMESYPLRFADAEEVAQSLERAFGRRSTVGVSADRDSGFVFVMGRPDQQKMAAKLIEQMDRADDERLSRTVRIFSLYGADTTEAAGALERLFETARPRVDVQYDRFNEQVVVIGTAEQLGRAEEVLEQFRPEPRRLEIFPLRQNEPDTARQAIDSLFSEIPYNIAPSVLTDEDRQQVLVRGTDEQLEQVTELLVRMGEAGRPGSGTAGRVPATAPRFGGGGRVRTIEVGPDGDAWIRRLQELWPSVRDNPLRVVRPDGAAPEVSPALPETAPTPSRPSPDDGADNRRPGHHHRPGRPGPAVTLVAARPLDGASADPGQASADPGQGSSDPGQGRADDEHVDDTGEQAPTGNDPGENGNPGENGTPGENGNPGENNDPGKSDDAGENDDPGVGDDKTAPTPEPSAAPSPVRPAEMPAGRTAAETRAGLTNDRDRAPVLLIPGEGTWTIASEDTDALDALAELIESGLSDGVTAIPAGVNHAVYVLKYADAGELQTVFTNLFRETTRGRTTSSRTGDRSETRVVADPRINALIVRGSRTDRATVEELLTVLDSREYVGVFQPSPPQYVPVGNADAERVEQVLRIVYRNELSSVGGRPPLRIPAGISPELATMMRQINAAASGPLLTISVDELTNAIVMRAPPELAREVREFIAEVDRENDERRVRALKIVPLSESNADGIERAIRSLRGTRSYRRR